jgi:drug/metabolite transporter (DMT)-like permease
MTTERSALILLYVAPAFWAANFVIARAAVGTIEPHALAFFRWLIAFCLMLPIALPELRARWPLWRLEWANLLLLGALGMWICGATVYIGAGTTAGTNIGLIYAIAPVLIAAVSARWFGERMSPRQRVGLALSILGVALIILKGSIDNLLSLQFTPGDFWVLAGATSWAFYSIAMQARKSVLDPFARLTAIVGVGLIVLAPFTLAEAILHGTPTWDWRTIGLMIAAGLLPGFGAYQAHAYMQRHLGPTRTAVVLYLNPLYAAVATWLLLDEPPHWYHAAGALLVLPGIWLVTTGRRAGPAVATQHRQD